MSGLSEEQITYLRDVLGLESLVLGARPAVRVEAPPPPPTSEFRIKGAIEKARLLVVAAGEREYPLEGEAGDLATKMIQAMKLAPHDVAIVEWTSTASDDVREIWKSWKGYALSFGERAANELTGQRTPSGSWFESGECQLMVTDTPARLIAEPARKKVAWAHLQSVMKLLA